MQHSQGNEIGSEDCRSTENQQNLDRIESGVEGYSQSKFNTEYLIFIEMQGAEGAEKIAAFATNNILTTLHLEMKEQIILHKHWKPTIDNIAFGVKFFRIKRQLTQPKSRRNRRSREDRSSIENQQHIGNIALGVPSFHAPSTFLTRNFKLHSGIKLENKEHCTSKSTAL